MTRSLRDLAIRWFEEVWNQKRDATVEEMMSATARSWVEGIDAALSKADFIAYRQAFLDAASNLQAAIDDVTVQDDKVTVSWRMTARHTGPGLGLPPTGRVIRARGMTWLRFEEGQIIEGWDRWNRGEVMASLTAPGTEHLQNQLGLTPREADVALLMAERRTTKEIARDLEIRPNTARRHCQKVLDKLGLHRKEDVAEALGVTPGAALLPHGSDLEEDITNS